MSQPHLTPMDQPVKRKIRTTAEQKAAIIEWYRRKREIGTVKSIARVLGMNPDTVARIIELIRKRP